MFTIYLSIIFITTFFIVFGYYNELALQEKRQYDKLRAAVSSMAINMDGDKHEAFVNRYTKDTDTSIVHQDPSYLEINRKLREVVENNNLNSPMYTLVYNEDRDGFVYGIRSDNFIDFKNSYRQSPDELKDHYETGGTLPMYMSENGMWISAYHPIRNSKGEVVALLEADIEFSEFTNLVFDQYIKECWVALAVILALALILIPYARKILQKDEKQKKIFIEQRKVIESKNRDITDSIRYALKIQSAVMPQDNALEKNGKEGFIYHQAKDIVAGDFYWIEKHENYLFFAVADCTGHGVPGAIMSILCANAVNQIIGLKGRRDTGEILNDVRDVVIERIGKGEDGISDGMDIALCRLDLTTNELQYSGANNPIYIFKKEANEIIVLKPCKQPIGKYIFKKPFFAQNFQLEEGDSLYLFSDGFADQFGGPKGKKFKYKPFKEFIRSNANSMMDDQKKVLCKALRDWKGEYDQVDDICVMGIRI